MAVRSRLIIAVLILPVCIDSPADAQTVIHPDDGPAFGGALIPSVSPLPPDAVVQRWVSVAGKSGGGIAGVSADEGVDECVRPCTLVYDNTLGRSLFGPSGAVRARLAAISCL